jgi:hypothetical protein
MTVHIQLDPANPYDFTDAELEDLADQLRKVMPEAVVEATPRAERGYGGPYQEVVHVWVEHGAYTAPAAISVGTELAKWLLARWKRDRDSHPPPQKPRPRGGSIYVEETLVRRFRIDLPDGDIVEDDLDDDTEPPHPRPQR